MLVFEPEGFVCFQCIPQSSNGKMWDSLSFAVVFGEQLEPP